MHCVKFYFFPLPPPTVLKLFLLLFIFKNILLMCLAIILKYLFFLGFVEIVEIIFIIFGPFFGLYLFKKLLFSSLLFFLSGTPNTPICYTALYYTKVLEIRFYLLFLCTSFWVVSIPNCAFSWGPTMLRWRHKWCTGCCHQAEEQVRHRLPHPGLRHKWGMS